MKFVLRCLRVFLGAADSRAIATAQEEHNATVVNGSQADNGAAASGAVYLF